EQQGLPVVPFFSVTPEQASDPAFTNLEARVKKEFSYPVFVKPSRAGSSVGVSKAGTPEELQKALETAFQYDTVCLVEPAVKGREIECSVTGNQDAVSYAIGEILPSHEFYDYEAKYIDPDGAGLVIPADISEDTKRGVKEIAEKAYKSIYSQGYARVDFFIEQESNRILLNEINTIPGFTSISMFPMLCSENGLGYSSLLDLLIQLGIERYELRKGLQYGV
ncbi:MAG: ATP-grasp domain-containing protein, partial [Spirochaetia bacterium]